MLRALILVIPLLCLAPSLAFGSVVSFTGQITNRLGAGVGTLDPLPPPRDVVVLLSFSDGVTIVPVSGNVQVAGIGMFNVRTDMGASAVHSAGHLAFVLPLGSSRQVVIDYPSVPGTAIDTPTINLIAGRSATINFIDNGTGVGYNGIVTAAPEPSAMFALLGMVGAVGGYRRYKSKRKAADTVQ